MLSCVHTSDLVCAGEPIGEVIRWLSMASTAHSTLKMFPLFSFPLSCSGNVGPSLRWSVYEGEVEWMALNVKWREEETLCWYLRERTTKEEIERSLEKCPRSDRRSDGDAIMFAERFSSSGTVLRGSTYCKVVEIMGI